MKILLGYGKADVTIDVPEENLISVLGPNMFPLSSTGAEEVKRAMRQPIGSPKLIEIVQPGNKVVIITCDVTRPMPSKVVLPVLLQELFDAGIKQEDIIIVFSLGNHRKHTEKEKIQLVGESIYRKIPCLDSDQTDIVQLGVTSWGTPVDIFRPVVEADVRICLGNIEYHYFAGYSGGAKAIMPGVSTQKAIQANHSRMVKDSARAGKFDGNPVRADIDEVAEFVPIHFILNVVLDEHKNIIKAVAGHFIDAHREGCRFLDSIYKVKIKELADIAIVSSGGYPKDINLYQAQKALDNSAHAIKPGGILILVASCQEGLGEHVFERWMLNATSAESMIRKIKENFELGGHKAAAIAMVLKKIRILLVSEMESDLVKRIFLEPYTDVAPALKQAFEVMGSRAKVLVIPYGGSTLPNLEEHL